MCGIAGFTSFHETVGDKTTLKEMGEAIAHRGPDANGVFINSEVGLCHQRLSIIDLSDAGNQPMHSNNGKYTIVFNGEIYNFLELRKDLQAAGYAFNSNTDTEVILALYNIHGQNLLSKLNGMFSFAIWDSEYHKLFLARDRLGKKPLYYYYSGNKFIFASEIKAILKVPGIPKSIRPDALYDYFTYQYIPDPKTIFTDIHKLEPGCWMSVDKNGLTQGRYWDVSFKHKTHNNEESIREKLYDELNKSVRQRMISDVPLGAFLSGGIDSSGIVALMVNNTDKPVTTCTIGFDSEKFDEVQYAKRIADKFHTKHYEFTVRQNVQRNLERIATFFDEPFADPSFVPTYFVAQLARQKVKVALAGDGGDENFAGYQKYTTDNIENHIRSVFPAFMRKYVFRYLANVLMFENIKLIKKGSTLLNALSVDPAHGFFLTNSFFPDSLWQRLINHDFKHILGDYHPSSITEDYYHNADTDDHLSKILYTDIKTYLPGDILVKVDRMSMANSLEVRAPILDFNIVEYAASIPSNLKYMKGEKKYILKQCFRTFLPDDILYRKKMGFSVPLTEWLNNELRETVESRLFAPNSGLSQFFDINQLKLIWNDQLNGNTNYSTPLWSLLIFEIWWQKYMV